MGKAPTYYRVKKFTLSYVREGSADVPATQMCSKNDIVGFCRSQLEHIPIENVIVIGLSNTSGIVGFEVVAGTTNQCAIYPQNAFRFLLSVGASAFVVAHNHPGGSIEPSSADWRVTNRLHAAGLALDVPFLDHVLVGDDCAVSMRESHRWPISKMPGY